MVKIPPEILEDASAALRLMKNLAFEVLRECHDPDYETTAANVRELFNRMETEAFQLNLFEE